MRNFKSRIIVLCVLALCSIGCTTQETGFVPAQQEELFNLSLNISSLAISKNALTKQQNAEFPECLDDTPFYLEIVLMQDNNEMLGDANAPFRIDLTPNQMFTRDVPEMKLPAGEYYLDYCAVYNEAGDLLCLAPRAESPMAVFSDMPMPMQINLGADSKTFPDIPVLCFDDRDTNEYGYLFEVLENTRVENFCFFANYCSDNGRHFPAKYALDIVVEEDTIYSEIINNTGQYENGDFFADPLCVALPVSSNYDADEKYIDYTLSLLAWDEVYATNEEIEISGSLSHNDILAHFQGAENIDPKHIFFNCNNEE